MARAFVLAGSNIDPANNLRAGICALASSERVIAISTVYLTSPVGGRDQPSFYNCVVEIQTVTPPLALKFQVLRRIEAELGRQRTRDKHAPRTIDLDLIMYDALVVKAKRLLLPDPEIAGRPFLAVPLAELAPDLKLPATGCRIAELAVAFPRSGMVPLKAYTARLRRDLRASAHPQAGS